MSILSKLKRIVEGEKRKRHSKVKHAKKRTVKRRKRTAKGRFTKR
jgi:hypothetical protein